jgi:hypothetical protein
MYLMGYNALLDANAKQRAAKQAAVRQAEAQH